MPNVALEQEAIAAAITIALLYRPTVFTRFGYTSTQHVQSKPSRDFALTEALSSKVGLLQNFCANKKLILLSSNL